MSLTQWNIGDEDGVEHAECDANIECISLQSPYELTDINPDLRTAMCLTHFDSSI